MYVPAAFAETNLNVLHDFIAQNGFGMLVSQVDGEPFVTHLPLLIEKEHGPFGRLIGHVARANPHWNHFKGQSSLAVFPGPHAYVSPSWYESDQVVPTWNYVAVHAYGHVEIVDDPQQLSEIVQKLVGVYEQAMPRPWTFDDSTVYAERMLAQIVGFRMEIEKIEGKWKLNQNHPIERRRKVVDALQQRDDENSQAIAALMRERLPKAEL